MSNHTDPTGRTPPIVPGDLFARHQTITGLCALADFLETNPGVPVNEYGTTIHVPIRAADDASAAALVDQTAALLGVNAAHDTQRGGHYRVVGWVCGTCGGGGIASDGSTCPDCDGHGHTLTGT